MTLWSFLFAAIGPLVIRALIAIGFTAITFTGVKVVVDQTISLAQTNWATLPLTVLQLSSLAGVPEALGFIFAAITARMTLWLATNTTRLVFTGK